MQFSIWILPYPLGSASDSWAPMVLVKPPPCGWWPPCSKPSQGSISVSGYDSVSNGQKVREQIGFMTGQTALYDRLTPTEMVKYIADLHGMNKNEYQKRKNHLFDILDMHSFADRRIARLSSGMKTKDVHCPDHHP